MEQQTAPLDVAQEVMTQAGAFRRTLDDARDVGGHKGFSFAYIHHAQVGGEGGEVVIGDFGPGLEITERRVLLPTLWEAGSDPHRR